MTNVFPFEALDESPHAILLSDADGKLRLCNLMAAGILHTKPSLAVGRPCGSVAKFETLDGEPFCGPDCAIRRQARTGHLEPLQRVVVRIHGEPAMRVDLLTFLMGPPGDGWRGALHVLLPVAAPAAAGWDSNAAAEEETPASQLSELSARETDVLRLLASGLTTAAIADSLCISRVTVRTHVQRILKKLRLHRRLEAVLAFVGQKH